LLKLTPKTNLQLTTQKIKAQKEQVTKYSNPTSKTKVTEIHKKQNSQTI